MAPKKRPGLSDVADEVARIGRADEPPEPPPRSPDEYWHKTTVTLRAEQVDRLDALLAQWQAHKRVKVSLAETVRLALDTLIRQIEEHPDDVILALYRQEQREERETATRKFGRSRGAERYLKDKGML